MTLELMKQEERRKGEMEGTIKIAANMLRKNYTCEQISEATELSIADIKLYR